MSKWYLLKFYGLSLNLCVKLDWTLCHRQLCIIKRWQQWDIVHFIVPVALCSFIYDDYKNIYCTCIFADTSSHKKSSSFPQHKEKRKIIQPENCTDGTKSLHKHGRPEVSCSHIGIRSLCFPVCLLIQILICCPGSLFVCCWIPQRSIYIFHLCARRRETSGHSQAVWEQEHTSEESHLVCNTEQHKGESLRKKKRASCVLTLSRDTVCAYCRRVCPLQSLQNMDKSDCVISRTSVSVLGQGGV